MSTDHPADDPDRIQTERMIGARLEAARQAGETMHPLVEGVSGEAGDENARRLDRRREVREIGPLAIRAAEEIVEAELDRSSPAEQAQMGYKKKERKPQ